MLFDFEFLAKTKNAFFMILPYKSHILYITVYSWICVTFEILLELGNREYASCQLLNANAV